MFQVASWHVMTSWQSVRAEDNKRHYNVITDRLLPTAPWAWDERLGEDCITLQPVTQHFITKNNSRV